MSQMNSFTVRLEKVNAKGVKTPKVLLQKLHEYEQVCNLPVNDFTTVRTGKLQEAIHDLLTQLEVKSPKDTRVSYGGAILDDSAMSKKALSYNRTVYAMQLLDADYTARKAEMNAKIARIQSAIPTGQIEEFNSLVNRMSRSDFQNSPDEESDND